MRNPTRSSRCIIRSVAVLAVATGLFAACSDDGPAAVARLACVEGTAVSVNVSGTAPTVSWSPDCVVTFVAVTDSSPLESKWAIRTPVSRIASPIQVYTVPAGTYDLGRHQGLVAGQPYMAVIAQRDTNPETGAIGERFVGYTYFRVPETILPPR